MATTAPGTQLYVNAIEKARKDARKEQEEGVPDTDDRIAPPAFLEPAAAYISAAITALFYEQAPDRNIRFRVHLAPELFANATNDFFFEDGEEPFEITLMRVPKAMLDHDAEFRTPYLLSLVCEAYIAQVRREFPDWNRDVEDPVRSMALDVLDMKPESLAAARRMLWN